MFFPEPKLVINENWIKEVYQKSTDFEIKWIIAACLTAKERQKFYKVALKSFSAAWRIVSSSIVNFLNLNPQQIVNLYRTHSANENFEKIFKALVVKQNMNITGTLIYPFLNDENCKNVIQQNPKLFSMLVMQLQKFEKSYGVTNLVKDDDPQIEERIKYLIHIVTESQKQNKPGI